LIGERIWPRQFNCGARENLAKEAKAMCKYDRKTVSSILSLMLILTLGTPVLGQQFVTVTVGTVVPLRMDTPLSSNSSRVGDPFTATVFRSVLVDGRAILPAGATVEGHVTGITPGERSRGPATIAVAFDRFSLPNGNAIPIDATLTTLSEEGRRRIESEVRNQEGGGRTRRAVVFLGASRGAGATIGVAGGGADTTTVGAIVGTLLGNGERAEVQPGAEFGMMVERSFSVDADTTTIERGNEAQSQSGLSSYDSIRAAQIALRGRNYYNGPINGVMNQATREAIQNFQHDRNLALTGELDVSTARALGIPADVGGPPAQTVFTSTEAIRFAQITLRDRGYYTGPINGAMTQTTRNALRQLQHDRNLTMSGDLDLSTARELGIASDAGIESAAIEVLNPRAERIGAGSIRISADVHTQGGGWQIFVNRFVTGNTLHVYIRGVPPRYPDGSAIDHHPFTETYNDLPSVARVIFHGPQRDFTADLLRDGGGVVGTTGIGNPRQIALLANRLLQDFQRELNIRNNSGQVIFDTRRDFRPNEIELLSQMTSLEASAELYNQLTASITDADAVKGAAGGLMRQARLLERIMRRGTQLTLSSVVSADWQQLQAELSRISVIDSNSDSDIIR
jgi:peptidoglycan hydrolase-like protein with peptidoglycan-binding domain